MPTVLELTKKLLDQDSRWARIIDYAQSRGNPGAHKALTFLRKKWEPSLHRALDHASTLDYNAQVDPRGLNEILSSFHRTIYPAAREAGFPESSFVFDDISLDSESATNVSGFFDFLSIKKDDWQDKFFNDIDPILKFLPYGPALEQAHKARLEMSDSKTEDKGVSDMMASALKMHDVIVAAKKGDAKSAATLSTIKAQADAGDPAAVKAMDTARKINNTLNAKAVKTATAVAVSGYRIGVVNVRDHRPGGGATGGFVTGPQGTPVRPPASGGFTNTQAPVSQYPDPSQGYGGYPDPSQMGGYGAPPNPYAPYGTPPPNPYGYTPTPYGYTDPYSMAYSASPYGGGYTPPSPYGYGAPADYSSIPGHVPGDDYGPYYQFSGWGYNRPYRSDVPAPKHRLRSLYNLGLGA